MDKARWELEGKTKRPIDSEINIENKIQVICFEFLKKTTIEIEVLINKKKELIVFKRPRKITYLTKESKEKFLQNVRRDSHETKISELINMGIFFEKEMKINEFIFKQFKYIFRYSLIIFFIILMNFYVRFFGKTQLRIFEKILFFNSLLINLILIVDYPFEWSYSFIITFAVFQILFSLICLIFWFLLRFKIESEMKLMRISSLKGRKTKDFSNFEKFLLQLSSIYNEKIVIILSMHFLCAFFGLISSEAYYAIAMLSIINLSPTLKYITKSFTLHGNQLFFTFVLVLVLIYVYTVFSFIYFHENFNDQENCSNIFTCYISIINTGLTNGSGIIGMTTGVEMSLEKFEKFLGMFVLGITFFVFINSILMSTVYGIITNTFAELSQYAEVRIFNILYILIQKKIKITKFNFIKKNFDRNLKKILMRFVLFVKDIKVISKKRAKISPIIPKNSIQS